MNHKRRSLYILFAAVFSTVMIFFSSAIAGMTSEEYTISFLTQNQGSGGERKPPDTDTNPYNYKIARDALSTQPTASMSVPGGSYSLSGLAVAPQDQMLIGIYINGDAPSTNTTSVNLGLICGHSSGCSQMKFSNNGFSWSAPEEYSPTKAWSLLSSEGKRTVYVMYENGLGEWSGKCSDSIILDMTAPSVTISPAGDTYMENPQVTLTASETATIYYTTDDTEPTTESSVYNSPITLTDDATIKAFAVDAAGNTGQTASETYQVCNGSNLRIYGTVKDGLLDEPMPLVTITLDSGHTTQSPDGTYDFGVLPKGYYRIESVTTPSPGYATYQKEIVLCKDEDVAPIPIVLTKEAAMFGGETFAGYSVDSVNTATGNFFYDVTDLEIPGRGLPFGFDRTYNSQDESDGPLGYGWTHNYNITLTVGADNSVTVRWGDGKAATWTYDETEGYIPMTGVFDTLENTDGTFTVRRKDMIEYHFDTSNRLSKIQDENENHLEFRYTGDLMTRVVDTVNRNIEFSYDANGRIAGILDPIGRTVTFTYDLNGNLKSSKNLDGKYTYYTYDPNHQILTITDPEENDVYTNVYDDQRRVISSQKDAEGNQTRYTYDVGTRTTQIFHPNGSSSYHYYDDLLRLIQEKDPRGFSAYYEYNDGGSLSKVTDKNGNVTQYTTDDSGNVQVKTDPSGNQSSATYDANNNPLTKTDARGNTTTFVYDDKGNLISITDPLNNTNSFEYDQFGQLIKKTNAESVETHYEYDMQGNLTKVTRAANIPALANYSIFGYDGVGRKESESHPLDRGVAYTYDNMNRLTTVSDVLGGVVYYTYDDNGNKKEHKNALGNTTSFGYDKKNRLISETTPLNETESYHYDEMDRRDSVTNRRGKTSYVEYDAVGNVIKQKDAYQNTVSHTYDGNGNRLTTTDAKNNTTTFVYDELNRLTKTIDPYENTTTQTYDENGNLRTVEDPLGNTTTYTYDKLNRLLTITITITEPEPIDLVTRNTYDKLGRLVSVTDAKGNTTAYTYDSLGRLIKVVDPATGTVEAGYDVLGNRLWLRDTRGNETHYTYDKLNRLETVTDPLNNTKTMHYDAVGSLIALDEPDGVSTHTYVYDANNRLKEVQYPNTSTIVAKYTYDPNGNRISLLDGMGTAGYTYDDRDALSSVTDPFGTTVQYFYDQNGNRTVIQYPGINKRVSYTYDNLDRLIKVRDWNYFQTGMETSYEYDDAGRLIQTTMGNGAIVSYTYDNAGRLTVKEDKTAGGDVIARYDMTLDKVGNRTAMTATQPLSPTVQAADVAFSHDDGNRLTSANDVTFTYDKKGNRIERVDGEVTTQYAYDYRNMLTLVTDGTHVQQYGYNSDGHRLKAVRDGVETRYVLDISGGMENILAEMDQTNTVSKYFIYGDGLLYSVEEGSGLPVYYHYDTIGSTVALSDHTGSVTDQYAYLPYGEPAGKETVHENPFTYVGKYGVMAEPGGLYFMRARYYDPDVKRFLGVDPVQGSMRNSQSLSPYIYVENTPLIGIDPEGEIVLTMIALGIGVGIANHYIAEYVVPAVAKAGAKLGGREISDGEIENLKTFFNVSMLVVSAGVGVYHAATHALSSSFGSLAAAWTEIGLHNSSNHDDSETSVVASNEAQVGDSNSNSNTGSGGYNNPITTSNPSSALGSNNSTGTTDSSGSSTTETIAAPKEKPPHAGLPWLSSEYVFNYSSRYYQREFSKLLNSSLIDNQARSYIETRIYREAAARAQSRYREDDKDELEMDVRRKVGSLYKNFTQTLSKYSVLVKDISEIPTFNSLNMNRRGVYAN